MAATRFSLRREGALHLAMGPKQNLVYNWAAWASVLQNVISMAAFVYFWRSVSADTQTIAGLTLGAGHGLAREQRRLLHALVGEWLDRVDEYGLAD